VLNTVEQIFYVLRANAKIIILNTRVRSISQPHLSTCRLALKLSSSAETSPGTLNTPRAPLEEAVSSKLHNAITAERESSAISYLATDFSTK
jgi:hypothetical protein